MIRLVVGLIIGFGLFPTVACGKAEPKPGEHRPEPLKPVRVYNYPEDYERIYGKATPGIWFKYEVDDTTATFEVESSDYFRYDDEGERPRLYPDFVSAYKDFTGEPYAPRILPSLELIGQRGKFFDEGAYAAAEIRLDEGARKLPRGRPGFYADLARALANRHDSSSGAARAAYADAASYVATGIALASKDGKVPKSLALPPEIASRAEAQAEKFLADFPEESKPIGFYTWNKELRRVWAHRKWFQLPLDTEDDGGVATALALTAALQGEPALQAEYDAILDAHAGLTNPAKQRDCDDVASLVGDAAAALEDVASAKEALANDPNAYPPNPHVFCFLPPAAAIEEYVWEAIGLSLKGDEDLFNFLVDAIQIHGLTFQPGAGAGWYQYQQYAAEVFLKLYEAPEAQKLATTGSYLRRLQDAFRTVVTLAREAHAGAVVGGGAGRGYVTPEYIRIFVGPEVSLEPVPTYYLRVARSYGFLQSTLEKTFGDEAFRDVRGLREKGKAKDDLKRELADIRELYYGLYLESCVNLGLPPETEPGEVDEPAKAIRRAQRWLADWRRDPLMKKDIRVIIPVGWEGRDEVEPYLKCWAVVGVEAREFDIHYIKKPVCRIVEGNVTEGEGPGEVMFVPSRESYVILTPRVIEVTIPGTTPLSREEFRKVCDRYDTAFGISTALSSREPVGTKKIRVQEELINLITAQSRLEPLNN